jgi:hypothetical protein
MIIAIALCDVLGILLVPRIFQDRHDSNLLGVVMNWAAQRQEFIDKLEEFKKHLEPLLSGDDKPYADRTDEMRDDFEAHVRDFQKLIEIIDEQVAAGR